MKASSLLRLFSATFCACFSCFSCHIFADFFFSLKKYSPVSNSISSCNMQNTPMATLRTLPLICTTLTTRKRYIYENKTQFQTIKDHKAYMKSVMQSMTREPRTNLWMQEHGPNHSRIYPNHSRTKENI